MFYSDNLKKNSDIQHCFFSRKNGISTDIYKSLNCGIGSRDDKKNVNKNLDIVSNIFKIEKKNLILMNQTHGNKVKIIETNNNFNRVNCDAMLTKKNSLALCVLTADCIPILIYEKYNKIIGCIHAGWKGALNEIIENTLEKLKGMGGNQKNDFYLEFSKKSKNSKQFFSKNNKNTFNFDLRAFVNSKFKNFNIQKIDNILIDSFSNENEYFSFRRASKLGQQDYGRCISVIKKI